MGLMGEAGPEAIMPLARGADGKLGVKARGGGEVRVVMNIQTPDVEGFRRSQAQIAAQLGRAIGRGNRNR
jgi:phage-related minor tail protein